MPVPWVVGKKSKSDDSNWVVPRMGKTKTARHRFTETTKQSGEGKAATERR